MLEKQFPLQDGVAMTFEMAYQPVRDAHSRVIGVCLSNQDITERKRSEAALRRYKNIVSSIQDGIALVDRDFIYRSINYTYVQRLGLSREQIEGHHVAEVMGEAVFRDVVQPQLARCMTGEIVQYADWFDFADGQPHYINVIYTPYHDETGEIGGAVVYTQDITERKRAQDQEMALRLELERRHLLTTFFQNAGHEFRTPLTTINTSTYLLLRSQDAAQRQRKAEQIAQQVERITKLVDMLLLLTALETDANPHIAPVNIGLLVSALCPPDDDPANRVTCEVEPDLPAVHGDFIALTEALRQILDNAHRFSDPGTPVHIHAHRCCADHIRITIHDQGPGIAPDDLPHIFETFWRRDTAHSTPGFGLGLPIAERIITRHGGHIHAESDAQQGTSFHVDLPITAAAPQ